MKEREGGREEGCNAERKVWNVTSLDDNRETLKEESVMQRKQSEENWCGIREKFGREKTRQREEERGREGECNAVKKVRGS